MTTLTEGRHAGEFLVSEANGSRSREAVTLLSGQDLKAGAVLGKITVGAATTSGAGNTGTGAITMDATTPVLAGAKVGAYVATCIAAATNGGTFRVEDPDGFVLGDVAVGATFADDVKFVIADGGTDFIVGDKFTITVAAGSGKYKECNPANTDGSQNAAAILWDNTDATGGDVKTTAIVRDAEVTAEELEWFSGATDNQKATGQAQLAAVGIIAR